MDRRASTARLVVAVVRVLLLLLVGLQLAMPLWEAWGVGDSVRSAFSPYCHQRFDRSLEVAGAVLPVCARCTGLWVGALLAALIAPALRAPRHVPRLRVLAFAAAPMAADLVSEHVLGLGPHALARVLTGLCLGSVVGVFVLAALVRAAEEIGGRCETGSSTSPA